MTFESTNNTGDPGAGQAPDPSGTPPADAGVVKLQDGSIVVDGRVYTTDAAAKKIDNQDKFIETLKAENAEKDDALLKIADRLAALEGKAKVTDVVATPPVEEPEPPAEQQISKDDLVKAAVSEMKAQEVETQRAANMQSVMEAAQEAYGEDFIAKVQEIAKQKGVDATQLDKLAFDTPQVFRELFLPATKAADPGSAGSSVGDESGLSGNKPVVKRDYTKMSQKERQSLITQRMQELRLKQNPT